MNKYQARKTVLNGITFDSKAEAKRYQELLWLEKAGHVSKIERQPEYVLVYPFVHRGKKYRGVKYRADFKYLDDVLGWTVEDVKGHRTAEYRIKLQMLLTRHPDINFVEIQA